VLGPHGREPASPVGSRGGWFAEVPCDAIWTAMHVQRGRRPKKDVIGRAKPAKQVPPRSTRCRRPTRRGSRARVRPGPSKRQRCRVRVGRRLSTPSTAGACPTGDPINASCTTGITRTAGPVAISIAAPARTECCRDRRACPGSWPVRLARERQRDHASLSSRPRRDWTARRSTQPPTASPPTHRPIG
jgi:hypothetical protein